MTIYQIVARNIKYYREKKEWTTADLADATGYSEQFIIKLEEAYYTKKCTIIVIHCIARALGIDKGLLLVDLIEK